MMEKFFPNKAVNSIYDIDLEKLKKLKITGLIFDIDNTLISNNANFAGQDVLDWMQKAKQVGMKICMVSNASKRRVSRIKKSLEIDAIHRAGKPRKRAFSRALKILNIDNTQAAMIGDQIFTDIYGGNRMHMFTILVSPIDNRECFIIKAKRLIEKLILKAYFKRHYVDNHS